MDVLTKQEMKNVIEGKRITERIPNLCSFWVYPDRIEDKEKQKEWQDWLNKQVYDMDVIYFMVPGMGDGREGSPEEYCFLPAGSKPVNTGVHDSCVWLADWEDSDFVEEMYAKFPTPDWPGMFGSKKPDHSFLWKSSGSFLSLIISK